MPKYCIPFKHCYYAYGSAMENFKSGKRIDLT